jgi:hypothetical protein
MKNAEKQLRQIAQDALSKCDPTVTPTICHMIVESGMVKVEEMIINYAIKNNVGIPSAIALLESELS